MSDVPGIDHEKIHEDEIAELVRQRDEAIAQRDALADALLDCNNAIATLDLDAFGWGEDQTGNVWPIRDELLAKAREALAGTEEET